MFIKNKKKLILVILILLLFIVAATLLVLNETGIINRVIKNSNKEEIKKEISYEVYKHVDGKTAMLVVAEDTENGIEKIIYPNNEMELYCNGKTKVAFDYNTDITGKESLTFKFVNTKNEEIEKTIAINDQFYLDMINHILTKETETQKALTVNYKEGSKTKQYKIGEGETWTNYTNAIRIDDYQILETLGNESRNVDVSLRQIDKIGNEIITQIKVPINGIYRQEDTVIEGESILACVENNNLESGNYIFRVTGTAKEESEEGVIEEKTETIDYPIELYNYNDDANYITNNIGIVEDKIYTGMGKLSPEKRMLILKYNGDLTINEGVTITPTGTNEEINGATYLCTKKGMFIYCAGTLTNNGTITMTAKGTVNQTGENVYLYKNANNTYEYIPTVGGLGGISVSGRLNGISGQNAKGRQTGGGGSGGAWDSTSVAGTNGTAYAGGDGGAGRGSAGSILGQVGGLLIIKSNKIENNGLINSNGSDGFYAYYSGGGGSGGGSINLFYKTDISKGNIETRGGIGGNTEYVGPQSGYGGSGGTGSITIGNISTGTFIKDE